MAVLIASIFVQPSTLITPTTQRAQTLEILRENRDKVVVKTISRGAVESVERRVMTVSAYTAGHESTGKIPSDSDYGQVAISTPSKPVYAKEWHTIAAPLNVPIGTKVCIPYFKDKPNRGVFVVEDRGGGISGNRLDVYFGDPVKDETAVTRALKFGIQKLEVFIRKEPQK